MDGQDIVRMRARRRFSVPDEPVLAERIGHAVQSCGIYLKSLVSEKNEVGSSVVLQVLLCVAGVLVSYQRLFMKRTSTHVSWSRGNSTSLALAGWDLMSQEV